MEELKEFNKITIGFVIQKYILKNGKYLCDEQEFVASDSAGYEALDGESVNVEHEKEEYHCFDMVQPEIGGIY